MNSFPLYLIFILIALCHCVDVMYNHTNKENNLYFVFTTFRHGARKPASKLDFFGNYNYYAGALTKYGAIQHLEIGRNYRKRYSNFVNISYDKNELYVRSSNIRRTVISTLKELEGFFNRTFNRSNIFIAKGGGYFMNLFHLDPKEQAEMYKYIASCSKRKLGKNYRNIYYREIFPNIKKCHLMENIKDSGMNRFCDSMISHYFEYSYGNETYNIITRCSKENIQKFYDFCVEYYDSFRGIFQYMDNYINGRSKMRMMMIGGHDVTVAPLMDFFNMLNIIPRTHYPHYACNIVIELRKYVQDFYLEFYYNDVLKYNNTLENFKSILDNSKYSNLYNYCGMPSYLKSTNNATNQTINNQTVKNESKIENIKNETNPTINNQTNQSGNVTKGKEKIEIIEKNPNNLTNMTKNRTNLLNNNDTLIEQNRTSRKNQGKNIFQKSFNYLLQQDKNFYVIVICTFVIIVNLILIFVILSFIWRKNRRKKNTKSKKTVVKKENPNNISVMTSNDFIIKNEPQSNILKNLNTLKK